MHRSSEGMGELAGALAKAQTELLNPEKSLTAVIFGDRQGESRSFRYAPLSTGLDIIRKALGQHAIAVLQSTAIDPSTHFVVLTTTLAHASGQWVSSEWPVCRSDQTMPQHRMGAALTYARRYSLFSLVGIAGEDDIDSPELTAGPDPGVPTAAPASSLTKPLRRATSSSPAGATPSAILAPADSARAREGLLQELSLVSSPQKAIKWAKDNIKSKNGLVAEDAALIESAFTAKLMGLDQMDGGRADEKSRPDVLAGRETPSGRGRIDKSVLTIGEPKRYRDKDHLRFVGSHPCLVCGRQPADAHHLRFAQPRALGLKVSDEFTVPLCRVHHRQVHQTGNEVGWWKEAKINALEVALDLWAQSRGVKTTDSSLKN